MKEIKFRAWDKHGKTWITEPVGFTMSVVDGRFHIFGFNDAFADMYQKRIELQQYTGLKDRNGVEIYEDDIVESNESDVDGRAYQVTLEDGCFYASHEDQSYFLHELEWEIVANVYENPRYLQGIIE